jgi:2-hydroxychromene-2-carboxylate isomerase
MVVPRVTRLFALTYDYRCPYARIAHEHVLAGVRAGADWEVRFLPFSLGQAHVEEGEPPVWTRPEVDSGLLALQASVAVRDAQPEHFLDVHHALFEHRHVNAGQLRERDELTPVLAAAGADADAVWAEVDSGRPLVTVEKEHTGFVDSHNVWGVPTFVVDDAAVFVRLLELPDGDGQLAITTIERVLDQIAWPNLNEFKHTSIPR